ncbi:hypothetical protein SAMN05421788_11063 [Filimonas lacunae]|uniref:YD repeat-containing protein n=1 Tax=Filimonas lacunae TaxID=477680 RepID=A0A173M9W5_9BACT|nr:hypothetical protein [Filimonas lacunae]BAV04333.1 hypothetical protein FLA_0321 [Filimonas lacunae]SIT31055.1 hypothetical protein SAMN05421788_11063 [Filimonas lacunae]
MRTAYLILLLLAASSAFAQREEFERYYSSDTLYKNAKVKTVRDSLPTYKGGHQCTDYDKEGRIISNYNSRDQKNDKVIYRYFYKQDTLVCHTIYSLPAIANDTIYRVEKYKYNQLQQIETYIEMAHSIPTKLDPIHINYTMEKFIYNEAHQLVSQLKYVNKIEVPPFAPGLVLTDAQLQLSYSYQFSFNSNHQLVARTETASNRPHLQTDSFFYNTNHQLVKQVTHYYPGAVGELAAREQYHTTLISYGQGYEIRRQYDTIDGIKQKEDIFKHSYYKNGLPHATYMKGQITESYQYDYYP